MQFLAEKAGVPVSRLELSQDTAKFKYDAISDGHRWIFMTYKGVWLTASKARALCKEDVWDMYDMFEDDFKDHRETKILRSALTDLRKALCSRSRPDIFKKGRVNVWLKQLSKKEKRKSKIEEASS